MVNYREILRLYSLNHSQRNIAASVCSSRHTISAVLGNAKAAGVSWPQCSDISNAELEQLLFPNRGKTLSLLYKEPDYAYIHKELAKNGTTLNLLWTEYNETTRAEGNVPYMYTQFCEKYRKWARITKATMRIQHKPGDVMQVDWAGNTIPIFDRVTGEESKAYLFVAVLPCSCYTYVEACSDMKASNWLNCHAHAYTYFGGVTRLLIPDNLKTGVTRNTRYETILNRSYQELAEHYGTAIVPARVRHPKDKSMAEGTVRFASTWVIAALRNRKFFDITEVRQAVWERLEILNTIPFKAMEGCRKSAYLNEEKEYMKSLPASPYEAAMWFKMKVGTDYLVSDSRNKYSVPYDVIGEHVDVRITSSTVEVFFNGSRIASHKRLAIAQREPVVNLDHMPPEHRKFLAYNQEDFTIWAEAIGTYTAKVVAYFLHRGKEPEEGYKDCSRMTKLAKQYGNKQMENACYRLLEISTTPSIRSLSLLLRSPNTQVTNPPPKPKEKKSYGFTRGASYYRNGGNTND